jgi:hypothetical protein
MARKTQAILALTLSMVCLGAREAASAVIPVTTVEQKISATGGCSLQEAIYSANFDSNIAISGYSGSTPIVVVTQCVPGSGDDIIVLPAAALMQFSNIVDDAYNPAGPTATPIITSTITILGYGARLEHIGSLNFRLFTVGSTGHLTIRKAYIRGFKVQGGSGINGGGGGMGAGAAVYVIGGGLVIEGSTFEGNAALGGVAAGAVINNGAYGINGGGGGVGGNGGPGNGVSRSGGGGGGARGNGGTYSEEFGGGGGGTLTSAAGRFGGFACGGDGRQEASGSSAPCEGGGGAGGADNQLGSPPLPYTGNDGGKGSYGGGGGGGGKSGGGDGGDGGFGGGGGAAGLPDFIGSPGGHGGFGGGGGGGAPGIITDGDGGRGGFFAGDGGDSGGGGGGAGLGGAIFNDSGTVDIRNSTFTANKVSGGYSPISQDGVSGGGAILSRNGHLTVLNSTITGNLAHMGGGILVVQDSASAPTSFVLQNTIIANNNQKECAMTGFSIGVAFAGNLIVSNADGSEFDGRVFDGCGGVVSSSDPQLGPLAYNQGATPTMAIGSTSPAWNAADPGSSLPVDQRKQDRPAMGGFDIGAFELCLEGFGRLQAPCLILAGIEDPSGGSQAVQLTVEVSPPGGGTTTPAPGTQELPANTVVPLTATSSAGFRFTGWSPNVTNPSNPETTVVMNASQTVTASFALCDCAVDVTSSVGITYGGVTVNPMTRRYVQTVTLRNNSASTIAGPLSLVLDKLSSNVTLYNASGSTALVLPANSLYMNATTNLAPGQSVALQLQFTNPGNIVFSYEARVLAGSGSR